MTDFSILGLDNKLSWSNSPNRTGLCLFEETDGDTGSVETGLDTVGSASDFSWLGLLVICEDVGVSGVLGTTGELLDALSNLLIWSTALELESGWVRVVAEEVKTPGFGLMPEAEGREGVLGDWAG